MSSASLTQPQAEQAAAADTLEDTLELSVVMPCLNEAETLEICIRKAMTCMADAGIEGEVVIADNGSTDGSQDIARTAGARVVDVERKGYGAALIAGIRAAYGRYVIMGDSDDSYDFSGLVPFVEKLREGHDLVMGNRFKGGIAPGAMPPLHRYLGNPVLTFVGRLFFKSPCGDFHCGLRGFNRRAILGLGLRTPGMEFASEMVVKATLRKLKVTEVPTTLSPDGRSRAPHLRSWRDGWRHLRFLLMLSPRWLFVYPGLLLVLAGLGLMGAILPGPFSLGGVTLDVHSLVGASGMVVMGVQTLTFGWFAKQYSVNSGIFLRSARYDAVSRQVNLERVVIGGLLLLLAGLAGLGFAVLDWGSGGFGDLDYAQTMRVVVPAVTAMATGFQFIIAGFMTSILDMNLADE